MKINPKTNLPYGWPSRIKFFPIKKLSRIAKTNLATPKWLTEDYKKEIEKIYKLCRETTKATGIKHEVDHIVPICGKTVSGLHVPWNLQIITKEQNGKKSNKLVLL